MSDERRISVREAATRAGVSQKVIRRAIDAGKLPGYRISGMVKIVVLQGDVDRVFALERIVPKQDQAPVVRPLPRRPAARGSREALRAIEGA